MSLDSFFFCVVHDLVPSHIASGSMFSTVWHLLGQLLVSGHIYLTAPEGGGGGMASW